MDRDISTINLTSYTFYDVEINEIFLYDINTRTADKY